MLLGSRNQPPTKLYKLVGPDGKSYESPTPGTLGGHRGNKGYGRLDCPSALRWIGKGYYIKHRVFFADEATAIAAGYRPGACCLKERYLLWKRTLAKARNRTHAFAVYRKLIAPFPRPSSWYIDPTQDGTPLSTDRSPAKAYSHSHLVAHRLFRPERPAHPY